MPGGRIDVIRFGEIKLLAVCAGGTATFVAICVTGCPQTNAPVRPNAHSLALSSVAEVEGANAGCDDLALARSGGKFVQDGLV